MGGDAKAALIAVASDDQIHLTSLGEHLALLNRVEPAIEDEDSRYVSLYCHDIWITGRWYFLRLHCFRDV